MFWQISIKGIAAWAMGTVQLAKGLRIASGMELHSSTTIGLTQASCLKGPPVKQVILGQQSCGDCVQLLPNPLIYSIQLFTKHCWNHLYHEAFVLCECRLLSIPTKICASHKKLSARSLRLKA